MMFKVGDKVRSKYIPTAVGFITSVLTRTGDPPPGWRPTDTDFIPPKTPDIHLYKVDTIGIYLFEDTIEFDHEYYKMITRNDKLNELV